MTTIFKFCSIFSIFVLRVQADLEAFGEDAFNLEKNAKLNLNCFLFGNGGCNISCNFIGKLFVEGGEGTCDPPFTCSCILYQPTSLVDIWNLKFVTNRKSLDVLNHLKRHQNSTAYKAAIKVVKNPLLTSEEIKNHMLFFLPKLRSITKLISNQLVSYYTSISADDFEEQDFHNLSNFVSTELRQIPESALNEIAQHDYKQQIENFIDSVDDDVTIKFVIKQLKTISDSPYVSQAVRSLQRKAALFSLGEEEEDDEYDDDDERSDKPSKQITDLIANSVAKELIIFSDKYSMKSNHTEAEFELDTRIGEEAENSLNITIPNWRPIVELVSNNNETKEWRGNNSYIKYTKDTLGTIHVHWQTDNTTIHLTRSLVRAVTQDWIFGDVKISLNDDGMGNSDHRWNFGKTQYLYSRTVKGKIDSGWTNTEDPDVLGKYQIYIENWCLINAELFPKGCVIFSCYKVVLS